MKLLILFLTIFLFCYVPKIEKNNFENKFYVINIEEGYQILKHFNYKLLKIEKKNDDGTAYFIFYYIPIN